MLKRILIALLCACTLATVFASCNVPDNYEQSTENIEENEITSEGALEIAKEYWKNYDIEENGYLVAEAVNKNAPEGVYVFVMKHLVEIGESSHYSTIDEVWVNKLTGEATPPFSTTQPSDAKKAMEMLESAIKGEISVVDERQGETKLKSLRFQSNDTSFYDTSLEECKLLKKAILDVDGDGVSEYVIQSPKYDCIILRHCNGKVYSYRLDGCEYYNFNTDGTFYWYDPSATEEWECGLDKIVFEGEKLKVKPVYGLKYSQNPTKYEYFVEGEAVTEREYYDYRKQNKRYEKMEFSYLELTNSYPVTAEEARDLANTYWNHQDGCRDAGAGTVWTVRIELIDTPSAENDYYRAAFQVEWHSNGGGEGDECKPPYAIRLHDQILVNAVTGEIVASAHGSESRGVTIKEAIEIAKADCDFIDFENEESIYRFEYDANAVSPDHIYVIVIRKYVGGQYSDYAVRWVDKNTGEIVFPYYINGN